MTATAPGSWKNPKPLRNALADWASRDDTRPDPAARAAADTALGVIADTIAELAALGLRLEREIADSEHVHAGIIDDDGSCPASGCVLPGGHFPRVRHVGSSGNILADGVLRLVGPDADDDSGYHEASELGHDEQIAMATGDGNALTHTEAEDALTATGYSATEACRILLAVSQTGTYRDDTVTVTASPSLPTFPRYVISEPDGPLSGPQVAVVHSMAGLVHDEPEPGAGQLETTGMGTRLAVCGRHMAMDANGRCDSCDEVAVGAPVRFLASAP